MSGLRTTRFRGVSRLNFAALRVINMQVNIYNQKGEVTGKMKLDPKIFEVKINPAVVHQVATAIMANRRLSWAHTKTRGDVRGGGRKPWRQKGTGRARHGSIRSPIWVGGGVTFGPRSERNYKQKINKKMKNKAMFMSLTDKAKDSKLIIVDELQMGGIKTKEFLKVVKSLPIQVKAMFVLPEKNEILSKSARNIPGVGVKTVGDFNLLDVLNAKFLILTKDGVKKLEEKYAQ